MHAEIRRFMGILGVSLAAVAGLAAAAGTASAEVRTEKIVYEVGGVDHVGYLAWDDAVAGKRPGVIVVHEWWGLNEHARDRARELAKLGYVGFALDMYGAGSVAEEPDHAKTMMQSVMGDKSVATNRFNAGLEVFKAKDIVDAEKIAALGYCMGGGVVLHMARQGADLDGVVTFHGMLATDQPAQPGAVKAPIRVFNGAADPFVPPAQLAGFEAEMKAAGADVKIKNYDGVVHSFTNPAATAAGEKFNIPLRYDAAAEKDSWLQTEAFLEAVFKE